MPTEYYPLIEMALVLIVVVGWGVRELVVLRRYRSRETQLQADEARAASDNPPVQAERPDR